MIILCRAIMKSAERVFLIDPDTLTGLRDLYPDRELYLIMGADR